MARKPGQLIKNKNDRSYTVRIFIGRDSQGKRRYQNQTVKGNKKDAERVLNKMLRERDLGILLDSNREYLNPYLDRWLDTSVKGRVRDSSYQDYVNMLKYYVRPALGEMQLLHIKPADIQKVYNGMLERGLSSRTVRYAHTVLNDALTQAVKWRILTNNPADYVDLPRKEQKEMQVMDQEQTNRFLEKAKAAKWRVLFALMLSTGLRPSEVLGLKWSDIDFRQHALKVQRKLTRKKGGWLFEAPKTKKARRLVDYPPSLTELLLEHRVTQAEMGAFDKSLNLVFASEDGQPLHEKNILTRHFRPLLREAGLSETMRLYDLRHTHATLLLLRNEHPKVVSERLGHSSITLTLDTYSHVLPTLQKESAAKLEAMLFPEGEEVEDEETVEEKAFN